MIKLSFQAERDFKIDTCIYFSDIGSGWTPAVLNTKTERNFLKEGQRSFTINVPYWIGGSTDLDSDSIPYSNYMADLSGVTAVIHNDMFSACFCEIALQKNPLMFKSQFFSLVKTYVSIAFFMFKQLKIV